MKKGKIFALTSVLLALGLVACGEKKSNEVAPESKEPVVTSTEAPVTSQEAPVSAEAPTSAEPASSSQDAPVKSVVVSAVDIVNKSGKAYFQFTGTATAYTQAEFKWALALKHAGAGGDEKTGYILGGETFADADYNIDVTLAANGAFTFEYNLSDIQGVEAGIYFVTAAPKGGDAVALPTQHSAPNILDGKNRYYFRNDVNNQLTVCVDELPPVDLTEATIIQKEDKSIWAKVGGEAASGLTQADLDAFDSFVGLQPMKGTWQDVRRNKADGQYEWKLEGTKAYIYFDVSFFEVNTNYNTHLNVKSNTQADCKLSTNINEDYNLQKADESWIKITVYSNPSGTGNDEIYGNLGFKVTAGVEPGVHVHNPVAIGTKNNSNSQEVTLAKCADDGFHRISMNAQTGKLNGSLDKSTAGKLTKGSSFEFEVNLNIAADLTNVALIMGRSDSHYERHLFNEAIWNRDHPDQQVTLPGNSPDTVSEDEWRYTVEVINNGVTTAFPITNMKTAKELNGGTNPSGTYYFPFTEITLKNGTNTIKITRNQIGYANVFAGEMRLEFETTATVALADAPAVQ